MLPSGNLFHGPGSSLARGCEVEVGQRSQFPNFFGRLKALELLDHQVTARTQGLRTALHEIAIRLPIEVVEETADEDEIVLLVSQVIRQHIPGTMDDTLAHALLREDRCRVDNSFRQIEYDRA